MTRQPSAPLRRIPAALRRLTASLCVAATALGGVVCSCRPAEAYNVSVDIAREEWMPTDTLVFPIEVSQTALHAGLPEAGRPYALHVVVRHTTAFPSPTLSLSCAVERTDSLNRSVETLGRHAIDIPLTDADGQWDGDTWGSLLQREVAAGTVRLTFPTAGRYRVRLWPQPPAEPRQGLHSLGIILRD